MYDALTREYSNGNKEAVDLDEIREWSMRSLEAINKAIFTFQKRRDGEEFGSKQIREDCINSLFYLKERIIAIEKVAMNVSPFRSLSPKNREKQQPLTETLLTNKYGQSIGTTSVATMCYEGRDNPFN